jgi:hypothetical protein
MESLCCAAEFGMGIEYASVSQSPLVWELEQIVDATVQLAGKLQRQDGRWNKDVVFHGVDCLARNSNSVGKL